MIEAGLLPMTRPSSLSDLQAAARLPAWTAPIQLWCRTREDHIDVDPDELADEVVRELHTLVPIVHPRPVRVKVGATGLTSDPIFVARSLVAVADCVLALRDCLEETDFMGPLETMWDLGDEIDVDSTTIEAERAYFFTGGLIHVVAGARKVLETVGPALRAEPNTTPKPPFDLFARSRDLETRGWDRLPGRCCPGPSRVSRQDAPSPKIGAAGQASRSCSPWRTATEISRPPRRRMS